MSLFVEESEIASTSVEVYKFVIRRFLQWSITYTIYVVFCMRARLNGIARLIGMT